FVTTCCWLLASSTYFIVTWCPSSPPFLLMSCTHRSYPCISAFPSVEKSPLSDKETPIVIGAWGDAVVLAVELPHAARTRAHPATIIDTGLRMLPPFGPSRLNAVGSAPLFLALNKRLFYVRHGSKDCQ